MPPTPSATSTRFLSTPKSNPTTTRVAESKKINQMAAPFQCTQSPLPVTKPPSSFFVKQQPSFLKLCNTRLVVSAADRTPSSGKAGENVNNPNNSMKKTASTAVSNSNYVVPMDNSSCITRPLGEILRDLNKRIPDNIIKINNHGYDSTFIPWYHANRMLSFYAPGWCGEIRDVIFSDNGSVTVVYRVTIRGSDGEAYRESTGTISASEGHIVDPVAAAEEIAFCRACARFGLGLYLYHEE